MIVYIMFGGLSLFLFFLFFYVLRVEREFEKKFGAIELNLEEINRELFELKKKEKVSLESIGEIEKIIEDLVENVKIIEEENKEVFKALENEITKLYNEVKKNKLPEFNNVSKHDENRIIALYKNGYTIEEIARELRIPAGEVEFIVKFSNISKT